MQESVILWNQHRIGLGFTGRNGGRKTIGKFHILQLSQEKQRKKHQVKPYCIGFLCFSCTKPNTPSNKIFLFFIPLFFTCIPIIFLYFFCSYIFLILCSKGGLRLLPLLLLLTVHMSFYLYKGQSNNKTLPSLTNDCSCTTQERDPVAWWHFTFARFCSFFSDPSVNSPGRVDFTLLDCLPLGQISTLPFVLLAEPPLRLLRTGR